MNKTTKKKKVFISIITLIIAVIAVFIVILYKGFIQLEILNHNSTVKHNVIIDTDTGGDDAIAIMIAAKNENVNILGVTVAAGNVSLEQAGENALMCLEIMDNTAPVYLGAQTALDGEERETFSVYGKDGMGDADLIHPSRKPEEENAVDFILDTIKNNPDDVEIIALGPVTNIALAIQKDPETMSKVKKIWSMGTTGYSEGNATPVAEFNVYKDVQAYKIMVDSGLPITITGLDVVSNNSLILSNKNLDDHPKNKIDEFVLPAFKKLAEFNYANTGEYFAMAPDAISVGQVIWDDFIAKSIKCQATVIDTEGETYGQVIFYQADKVYESGMTAEHPNIELVQEINKKYRLR